MGVGKSCARVRQLATAWRDTRAISAISLIPTRSSSLEAIKFACEQRTQDVCTLFTAEAQEGCVEKVFSSGDRRGSSPRLRAYASGESTTGLTSRRHGRPRSGCSPPRQSAGRSSPDDRRSVAGRAWRCPFPGLAPELRGCFCSLGPNMASSGGSEAATGHRNAPRSSPYFATRSLALLSAAVASPSVHPLASVFLSSASIRRCTSGNLFSVSAMVRP